MGAKRTLIWSDNHNCTFLGADTEVFVYMAVTFIVTFVVKVDFVQIYSLSELYVTYLGEGKILPLI